MKENFLDHFGFLSLNFIAVSYILSSAKYREINKKVNK